jgi:hypothetical protein
MKLSLSATSGSACLLALSLLATPLAGAWAQSKAKEEPVPAYMQGQCRWTGTRVVHSLLREDTIAAKDHLGFYQLFKCPEDRLSKAFSCAVEAPTGANRPKPDELVSNCWEWLNALGQPKEKAAGGANSPEKAPK